MGGVGSEHWPIPLNCNDLVHASSLLVRTATPLDNAKAMVDFCCPFSRLHTDSPVYITSSVRQSNWLHLRALSYHFGNFQMLLSFFKPPSCKC